MVQRLPQIKIILSIGFMPMERRSVCSYLLRAIMLFRMDCRKVVSYDLTLKNSEVISAVSPKADGEGKTTAAGENHVTVGGKAFSFTEIYEISN